MAANQVDGGLGLQRNSCAKPRIRIPDECRDPAGRVWEVSDVARADVVSLAVEGPNLALAIRFERESEERFTQCLGDPKCQEPRTLSRLFELPTHPIAEEEQATGVGPAAPKAVALWGGLVASMRPDQLDDFERRTLRDWDRSSLGDVRRAIERRRRELGG